MDQPTVAQRARAIKLLILDVDGVLTDGRVTYDDSGNELKTFDIRDGHGLKLLMRAGIEVAWLSGRGSKANQVRAAELAISELRENCHFKLPVLEEMLAARGLAPEAVAFMGDDVIDLPPMRQVGLALCPADAVVEVRQQAHWVSKKPGGKGAVREACELLMKSNGKWAEVTDRYYGGPAPGEKACD
ncbi:MAG: phenylphosphate carboxylase subunit delta [Deltaproteobacteria bacterium]|nr:phenylphosphate carboxylase subunit delta [Deltaproteobacteria bacterium]